MRYALMAVGAHPFLHAGEIITLRSLLDDAAPALEEWGKGLA